MASSKRYDDLKDDFLNVKKKIKQRMKNQISVSKKKTIIEMGQ